MDKRKTVQLQADLQTDDDLNRFCELSGLLDVYTDWCGPCLGMLGSLRKKKMEVGDVLNLAIVSMHRKVFALNKSVKLLKARADTISSLNRFYKKSEPTWLFLTQGRAVNIMFGTDCPTLMELIDHELKWVNRLKERESYNITEMLPKEVERDNIKNAAKRAKLQKELEDNERKKHDYFTYVTDTIHENLPDIGVTIFGPHIQRDVFRQLLDFGSEKFGIQCKDRRNQPITKEQFETINYVCKNPLSADVINAIDGKDLHICFWKVPDVHKEAIPELLQRYADEIGKPHRMPPDEYRNVEQIIPPLAKSVGIQIEYELPADEECPADVEPEVRAEPRPTKTTELAIEQHQQQQHHEQPTTDVEFTEADEEATEYEENESEVYADEPKPDIPLDFDFDDNLADNMSTEGLEEEIIDETPKKNICTKTVKVPAVWVPKDWRTHAAIIYVIFRTQTNAFLPPDPVPDPPHVIMAFDTYKKKDLINFAERYKEDIPLYGFFTSDEAEEAKLIANSKTKYAQCTPSASDKLIFKVNKRTSNTMLSLATYGPTYVSQNTTIGAQEAKIFFPDDYISAEQEMLESLAKKEEANKKAKKGKKAQDELTSLRSYERLQAEAAAIEAKEQAAMEQVTEGTTAVEQTQPAEGEGEEEIAGEVGEQKPPIENAEQAAQITAPAENQEQTAAAPAEENAPQPETEKVDEDVAKPNDETVDNKDVPIAVETVTETVVTQEAPVGTAQQDTAA